MRFFSKFILICNCCFLLSAILRYIEIGKASTNNNNNVVGFQPLESSIVILGYSAIIFNFIFLGTVFFYFLFNKATNIEKWLIKLNLLFFVGQIVYFFFT
jgi:hypothetical protein